MLSLYAVEVEARHQRERVRRHAERAHLLQSVAPGSTRPRLRFRFGLRRLLAIGQLGGLRVPWSLWG